MAYTIGEMNDNMTIFYSKNNGRFMMVSKGIIDWGSLDEQEADWRSFCIRKVLPINENFLKNPFDYIVDLKTNCIIKKPTEQEEITISLR